MNRKKCKFCDSNIKEINKELKDGNYSIYKCKICGTYKISGFANAVNLLPGIAEKRHLISGYIRENNELGLPIVNITTDCYEEILKSPLIPQNYSDKFNKVLFYFERRTKEFGDRISTPPISIGYVKNNNNLKTILQELLNMNYIKGKSEEVRSDTNNDFISVNLSEFYLTLEGMEYIKTIRNNQKVHKDDKENAKHVFISYVTEDKDQAIKLRDTLKANKIKVWMDRYSLQPGVDWEIAIENAIKNGAFFIACFSENYFKKTANFMNEELNIAIEQLRKMQDGKVWFIPVKFSDCKIPHMKIRPGKYLDSKQWVALYENWEDGINRIVNTIKSS